MTYCPPVARAPRTCRQGENAVSRRCGHQRRRANRHKNCTIIGQLLSRFLPQVGRKSGILDVFRGALARDLSSGYSFTPTEAIPVVSWLGFKQNPICSTGSELQPHFMGVSAQSLGQQSELRWEDRIKMNRQVLISRPGNPWQRPTNLI